MSSFDAVVIGAGVMGSACALELSRRGGRVAVLERAWAGHPGGSSHGPTRIFRLSYPDPDHVVLARQSLDDWRRLERDSRQTLLDRVGGIDTGDAAGCAGALEVAGVGFEEIDAGEAESRFGVRLRHSAIFQPDAAVISAAATVAAQLELATRAGAQLVEGAEAASIEVTQDRVTVRAGGSIFEAGRLVLCAGAWTKPLAASVGFDLPLVVTREQVAYLEGIPDAVPILIDWTTPARYLVPWRFGAPGARVGLHHDGQQVDPDDGPFPASTEMSAAAAGWASQVSGVQARVVGMETCLYTNTPDEDFIIQTVGPVTVVSACSGHGFKFGPRIGRVVADIIEGKPTGVPPRLAMLWEPSSD